MKKVQMLAIEKMEKDPLSLLAEVLSKAMTFKLTES